MAPREVNGMGWRTPETGLVGFKALVFASFVGIEDGC